MNGGSNNKQNKNIKPELLKIADIWYRLSQNTEKKGTCSIGDKLVFLYEDIEYHMYAQSPYKEDFSFKQHLPFIKELLESIDAKLITFRVGKPI